MTLNVFSGIEVVRIRDQLPRGVSLLEALMRSLSSIEKKRMAEYGERATELKFFLEGDDRDHWYFRHPFEKRFVGQLSSRHLVATGILKPPDPRRPRRVIPFELWEFVYVDFERSAILWENREYVHVEVLTATEFEAWNQGRADGTVQRVPSQDSVTLSEDGVLRIGDQRMVFRGAKQRRLVELLIETLKRDEPQTVSKLLAKAGFSASVTTLSRAFQGNPSWSMLRQYIERPHGLVLLKAARD